MDTILVAGTNTVAGANCAAALADHPDAYRVLGLPWSGGIEISGTATIHCDLDSPSELEDMLTGQRVKRIIYAGPGAISTWENATGPTAADVTRLQQWITAADAAGVQLTLLSSDAVFSGPWMFHAENSPSLCLSEPAQRLRQMETELCTRLAHSLVLRTHTFGWSPTPAQGELENLLKRLEKGGTIEVDCFRHASPILATDLADVVMRAWQSGLDGIYHVAGAERINPAQFIQRFADHFHCNVSGFAPAKSLTDRVLGYGCGETSLQTRKIRRALGITMPLLNDGLARLVQQNQDGFRQRIGGRAARLVHA